MAGLRRHTQSVRRINIEMTNMRFILFFSLGLVAHLHAQVKIDTMHYLGRPHFRIGTPAASWYYDRAGGGFSALFDSTGRDWIGFRMQPWGQYPASAASSFRGMPNLVYRSGDSGAGHPGHDLCVSTQTAPNQITTRSLSGRWVWHWTFYPTYAILSVDKVDTTHAYWFLYEGTPGGRFSPAAQYFGSDQGGPRYDQPDFYTQQMEFDHYHWAYFGDTAVEQVLFVGQLTPDTLQDTFSYLGDTEAGVASTNGMVVFGLGRGPGNRPLFTSLQRFVVGFWPHAVHKEEEHRMLTEYLNILLTKIAQQP
ncbi:MAG: hypothetical protein D6730_14430 [Bacteroidetes bacterium]|nr:MAG: hypothetical protein D6730_14430 [Bacteroidota bacterium]